MKLADDSVKWQNFLLAMLKTVYSFTRCLASHLTELNQEVQPKYFIHSVLSVINIYSVLTITGVLDSVHRQNHLESRKQNVSETGSVSVLR
jgi:hypothetical protein